ncbi:MAG: DUF4124 domain-containing protein [Candidatus Thiodiazotropha sp.]
MESRTTSSIGSMLAIPSQWLILFLLFLMVIEVEADVYKWIDEKGQVHFSDRPVAESSTEVKIKSTPVEGSPSETSQQHAEKRRRLLEVYEEDRAKKKEAKTKQQEARKQRKRKCVLAKDRYNSHSRASGIYGLNKDGTRVFYSDEERQRHMKKLKADIARWCN